MATNSLAGKNVFLCGGTPRADVQARLERQLGCRITWARTSHSGSPKGLRSSFRRADVVLLWYGGTSHVLAQELNSLSREAGAPPLVRLPGGYSASQIELSIRAQASLQ